MPRSPRRVRQPSTCSRAGTGPISSFGSTEIDSRHVFDDLLSLQTSTAAVMLPQAEVLLGSIAILDPRIHRSLERTIFPDMSARSRFCRWSRPRGARKSGRATPSASRRIRQVTFGVADYSLDTGMQPSRDHSRARLYPFPGRSIRRVHAGLEAPIDTVWLDLDDADGLQPSPGAQQTRGLHRQALHPPREQALKQATPSPPRRMNSQRPPRSSPRSKLRWPATLRRWAGRWPVGRSSDLFAALENSRFAEMLADRSAELNERFMEAAPEFTSRPVIIEAAINGARSKASSIPTSRSSSDEIVDWISACRGCRRLDHSRPCSASPSSGPGGHHDSAVYKDAFARRAGTTSWAFALSDAAGRRHRHDDGATPRTCPRTLPDGISAGAGSVRSRHHAISAISADQAARRSATGFTSTMFADTDSRFSSCAGNRICPADLRVRAGLRAPRAGAPPGGYAATCLHRQAGVLHRRPAVRPHARPAWFARVAEFIRQRRTCRMVTLATAT